MSEYYKVEDVINTLADLWRFEQEMEYSDTAEDIEEWRKVARKLFADLPTIKVSEDCISREWLVNHFKDIVEHYEMRIKRVKRYGKKIAYDPSEQIGYWKDEIAVCKHFIKEIENAPSVVPSRAEGEWLIRPNDLCPEESIIECTVCHEEQPISFWMDRNYCPNCGAKMKGKENE